MKKGINLLLPALAALILVGCSGSNPTARRSAGESSSAGRTPPSEERRAANEQAVRSCPSLNDEGERVNLVVIAGNRSNTYELPAGSRADEVFCSLVARTFERSNLEASGNVAFVVSDGDPWQAQVLAPNGRPDHLQVSANNDYMLNNRIQSTISHVILPFMDSEHLQAKNREADLLEALKVASRILRDMDPARENHLLIIDSGITTAGHIDMREFDVMEDGVGAEVRRRLQDASLLPDLAGVNVSFFHIGSGAYPQQVHSGPLEEALMAFWRQILEGGGANVLQMQGRSIGGNPRTGLPFVSPVDFNAPEIDLSDLQSIVFSEEMLGFLGGTSEFLDEEAAKGALRATALELAAFLRAHPENHVYIVGSQARTQGGSDLDISQSRADRVKGLLVSEFGLFEERLISIGANVTEFSWRNTDEFLDGQWSDGRAQENRVVAIIPNRAPEASELRVNGLID